MNEKYFVPILLGIITIVMIRLLFLIIKKFTSEYSFYLNSLGNATTSQIRNEIAKNQRYCLIKNLSTMKKYLGWSIFLIVLTIISLTFFIVVDSKDYFKQYFEVQKTKLHLATDKSVDSMQIIISKKTIIIDSLNNVNKFNSVEMEKVIFSLKKSETAVKNLENVVKHQNNMLTKLQEDIERYRKLNNAP